MKRIIVVLTLFALVACIGSDEDKNVTGGDGTTANYIGIYEGHLTINRREAFDPYFPIETIDSVSFDLNDPNFMLTFHTQNSNLCNVVGEAIVNSMNGFVTLIPKAPLNENCDNKRWPQGLFVVVADSINFDMTGQLILPLDIYRDDTIKFSFDLVKK